MEISLPLILVLLIAMTGCQSANALQADAPTNTALPLASNTSLPPTPMPTAVPPGDTPTPPPTVPPSPTPLPPVPTADFAPTDIIATWTRSDPDRGDLFLTFYADGLYAAAHGTPDGVVHSGEYSLDGRLVTFINGWNCSPMPDGTTGQYVLKLLGGGRWLYIDLYADECPDRPSSLSGFRWVRYEAGNQ